MANLQATTVSGAISATSIIDTQTDSSGWYKLGHCVCDGSSISDCLGTGHPWLHVRTPWPINSSAGMGWNPYMLRVVGYHTYSGECFHDWTAIINTNGSTEDGFYGSNIRIDRSLTDSSPYVYASTNTYGGYKRMCFSMRKLTCCCTGFFWVNVMQNGVSYRDQHPWATFHDASQTTQVY
jgi:hypothetical protein